MTAMVRPARAEGTIPFSELLCPHRAVRARLRVRHAHGDCLGDRMACGAPVFSFCTTIQLPWYSRELYYSCKIDVVYLILPFG